MKLMTHYQLFVLSALCVMPGAMRAAEGEHPRHIEYPDYPSAPFSQSSEQADAKSVGCIDCHTQTDAKTMHRSDVVILGCTDCHGGDANVRVEQAWSRSSKEYGRRLDAAHVQPLYPETWHYPHSENPENSYALLNKESPEYVRFVNPSDYRVAEEACGACHLPIIKAAKRSIMATGAMLFGGAAYNNGILPFKNYILGEAYTREGEAAIIDGPVRDDADEQVAVNGILPRLYPFPPWETLKPGDIFRVFERGGRNLGNLFPETGLPNALGLLQRIEEPGRPDFKQSNRGPGTGGRISVPVLNMHKTRLNDPLMWFLGTNEQPGDYRTSGCGACHVVYANDRDPRHSGQYAAFGHSGKSQSVDPTISKKKSGHPLSHSFTTAIPTSQCMVCHMHQPNMFVNTYLGYTMWDYESDAPFMWPEEQRYPSHKEMREILDRNPEGAAVRGKWSDPEFLSQVSEMNPKLKDTQFADYHGHGWNFRAIFKRDRKGNLLDADGEQVANEDPQKFSKAVHMSSIHLDNGMHCVDCHFAQDSHGTGHLYGEVALAVEIDCKDCHGSASEYPSLRTSGPAAPPAGNDLRALRNSDGRRRFEWVEGGLVQRSVLDPSKEWKVSLVKDSVSPAHPDYNEKSARAKLMKRDTLKQDWGTEFAPAELAHQDSEIECYTCHTSWTTSCAGCHLPVEANWKTDRHHYEGGTTRNYATYNPQVVRDQMFMLGKRGERKGGKIAPVRSSSALVLSSTNSNRERIYIQQPPIAASGHSSQALNPHFPHTVRKSETKDCEDCHLSKNKDNNAIMAQLLLLGTNYTNFIGFNAWVGTEAHVQAVPVTEWDEPQAVIGSYLHKYAYPDFYAKHVARDRRLPEAYEHGSGRVECLQLRGEYLFAAESEKGFRVYDVASIANKGVSQRIITAPFSPLGQDTHVKTRDASCVLLPANQPIHPVRNEGELMRDTNKEQPTHPIYNYALVTDRQEGLILVDVNTLSDGEFRNNNLQRALTFNDGNVLDGARHLALAGHYAYIVADAGIVVLNLDDPLKPVVETLIPMNGAHSVAIQFRYLFVTDKTGLRIFDITQHTEPREAAQGRLALRSARRISLSRTYAFIAGGGDGLVIVDIENPESPVLLESFDGEGRIKDANDVVIGSTNASLFAYVADGRDGLYVVQLTAPDTQPNFYGFSPVPKPELVAWQKTESSALALSRGLERDRGVDETGGQISVFGRLGSRPLNYEEMRRLYVDDQGRPWYVENSEKILQKVEQSNE